MMKRNKVFMTILAAAMLITAVPDVSFGAVLTEETDAAEYSETEMQAESMELIENPFQKIVRSTMFHNYIGANGLKVKVNYQDGTSKIIVGEYMEYNAGEGVAGLRMEEDGSNVQGSFSWKNCEEDGNPILGENAMILSCQGVTLEIPVAVIEVKSISILKEPEKIYEDFGLETEVDLYGLALDIVYTDDSSEQITVERHRNTAYVGQYEIYIWSHPEYAERDGNRYATGRIGVYQEHVLPVYYRVCEEDKVPFYTVTYQLNGGVNHSSNPTRYENGGVSLKNPSRPGYLFAGWYTDSGFKNKITQIAAGAKQNYVLYAKWEKVAKPGKVSFSSVKNSKSKKALVKYKKVKNADGYEIVYSTNRKFKKASSVTAEKTKATADLCDRT